MEEPYKQSSECCGCAACMNLCPQDAISMRPDADGFLYPKISSDLCIECSLCSDRCDFKNSSVDPSEPLSVYAAKSRTREVLVSSSSGGVFSALASIVFSRGGVVFGCAFDDDLTPTHFCIDDPSEIHRLQGSKYAQSNIHTTYKHTERLLKENRWVLFTGTPCQIAGLKSFLGCDYESLVTADLICHGVPSAAFFKGYIEHLEEKLKGNIVDFKFRNKKFGWGLVGTATYWRDGVVREETITPILSYYYSYFLEGDIYRQCCYVCSYAQIRRHGDLTMGDYWGVEKFHPEVETGDGVSVLLVNSQKGMALIEELSKHLILTPSTLEFARRENGQLNGPTARSPRREDIYRAWRNGGARAVADAYYGLNRRSIWAFRLKRMIPKPIKTFVKKVISSAVH